MVKIKHMDIPIEGMHCASCVLNLNKAFEKIDGVENVDADLTNNKLHIDVNPKKVSFNEINKTVESLGFTTHTDEITLRIEGMHCASCVMNVENFLGKLDGIFNVHADLTTGKVKIKYDSSKVTLKEIEPIINSLGFKLLGIDGQTEINEEEVHQKDLKDKRNRIIVGFTFSAILMYLMYFPIEVPYLTMGQLSLLIAIGPFLYISLPIIKDGFKGLTHKNLNMDVMYAMGILVAFISSVLGTFNIILDHTFMLYETSIMLPSFLSVGRYLEAKAKYKTSDSIKKLIGLQPKTATLIEVDENKNIIKQKEIGIEDIKINDILIVKPGDKIPTDAIIFDGSSDIDESMITGEPLPKTKHIGDEVFAGTVNQDGLLKIKTNKIGKETLLSQIIDMVEKAQSTKPPVQKIADTVVSYFIPVIITIALIAFCVWYFLLNSTLLFALTIFISVLVVACPCSLGLATPTAVTVGLGRSAEYGILIKNSDTLETASNVKVAMFDKTGTITEGEPKVDDILTYGDITEEELLQYIASIENNSQHPIAKSILKTAKENNINILNTDNFENITGKGLKAEINNQYCTVGNINFLKDENIVLSSEIIESYQRLLNENKTIIFLAVNRNIVGLLSLVNKIKNNSKKTINALQEMDIETYMVTGDNEKTAKSIASKIGIDNIQANVLPQDKLNKVVEVQKDLDNGKVLFAGDGINDAPALSQADVGVAMGNGTDIAMESGDIVVVEGDLENVVAAIQLSNKVMSRIKQNLFWAFAYNVILIPIAAGILYPSFGILFRPEYAALAMALSSVTVISLSLLLKRYVPPIKV